jgi:hypothetical protein
MNLIFDFDLPTQNFKGQLRKFEHWVFFLKFHQKTILMAVLLSNLKKNFCTLKILKFENLRVYHMGNLPSKHGKKRKNAKMVRKILWSWSGESSKWHMFFGPKSVIFKHNHLSFAKKHQKNVKFCTID